MITQAIVDDAMKLAHDEVAQRYLNSTVVEQSGMKYYNSEQGSYYYRVKTLYRTESGAYGCVTTYYDLSNRLEVST